VSTSFHAIERAIALGAQLLITHHPSWDHVDLQHAPRKRALLREHGISQYAAHSALDGAESISNSDLVATRAGIRVERRFLPYFGGFAGVVGQTEGTFESLVQRLKTLLSVPIQSWKNTERFGVVAVAAGRADNPTFLEEARAAGADTYVTGEGNLSTKLYARESEMNLVFGTHYATEMFGVQELGRLLEQRFGLSWSFIPEAEDIR
jgi:putative NIF3 family GTP cyclohydrolase 1 type 2